MALVIPSIFSVIDKMSGPIKTMTRNIDSFASKLDTGLNRSERAFRKLTPALSSAQEQLLSMVGTAAAVGGLVFSGKSIMDYETAIASLSAITGTSGKTLDVFKSKIKDVSVATNESAVNVANAFTMIGNNSPALLKDANALAEVTKNSILLAQAAKMELAPAADYLTTIMNQFDIAAKDSKKVIDLLAGGMVIGSTDIDKVADAMTRFGGVASQVSGTSLQESVTAIEAISDKMKDAEKVGTQFRNMFLIMSNIKGQDPKAMKDLKSMGVNMDIVARKGEPLINKLNELKKLSGKSGALEHVFGKENVQAIIPLLASTEKYTSMLKTLTNSVEAQNAAQKMADKNNATLARSWEMLKNKFVTWLVTSDEAAQSLGIVKNAVKFLSEHMVTILKLTGLIVGVFTAWKIIMIAARTYLFAYNVVLGVNAALTGQATVFTAAQTVAMTAANVATKAMTAAQWLLNLAMDANPIGLIIIAIAALITMVVLIVKYYNEWGAALSFLLGPLGWVINLVQSFRRNWDMIKESFAKGGILEGIKAIGKTILDAVLMPLQQILEIIAKITGANWAANAAKSLDEFRSEMGVNVTSDESGQIKPAVNGKVVQNEALAQRIQFNQNSRVNIDINDPNNRTTAYSPDKNIGFNFTSTK